MQSRFVCDYENIRLARNAIDFNNGKIHNYVIERTVYLGKAKFVYFREHLLEEDPNIIKYKDNMYVDENGVWHVVMFCCLRSDIMILVNSKRAKYAKYISIICNGGEKVEKRFATSKRY